MRKFPTTVVVLLLAVATVRATPIVPHQAGTSGWTTFANADRPRVLRGQGDLLWVGTDSGGLIGWNTRDGTFVQRLYPQDGLAGNTVTAITPAPNGELWVATRGGVSLFTADGIGRNFTLKNTAQRGPQKATVQDNVPVDGTTVPVDLPNEGAALAAFQPGYLMFGTDPTIYFYRGWDEARHAVVISPGLHRNVSPGTPVYAVQVGLAADDVRDVAVDAAGRVWISTVNGVNVFENGRWTVFTVWNSGLARNDCFSLAIDGVGRVWISHGVVGRLSMYDGSWHTYEVQGAIQDLAVDPSGTVWAATSPICNATGTCIGGGVWFFDGREWQQRYTEADGIASDTVTSIVFSSEGYMWLGHKLTHRVAVSQWNGSRWQTFENVQRAIEAEFPNILASVTSNDLWAVAGGRVWTRYLGAVHGFNGTDWQALYTGTRILNSNLIRALAIDDQERVWVGTWPMWDGKRNVGGGLNMWDGTRWTHFTRENSGLASNMVSDVIAGRGNYVWLRTAQGQIQSYHDGTWNSYASLEELIETEYDAIVAAADLSAINEQRLWRVDPQGRVWIWGTGARYFRPSERWVSYTFENTLRRANQPVATVLRDAAAGTSVVPSDIADSASAQAFFPSGYLMIGDDPTLYRFESFLPDFHVFQVSPPLQRDAPQGTPIYPVELGLVSTAVNDIAVTPDGRIWFASPPARYGATPLYGGIAVLDLSTGAWTHYTVGNTSRRGEEVTTVTADARAGDRQVSVGFADERTADKALASGYVMFQGDPTLYVYQGFSSGKITVTPWFTSPLERIGVGLQQDLPAGTAVYAVEATLSGDQFRQLALDADGNVWVAIDGVGVSRFNGSSWTLYRLGENGVPRQSAVALLTRGREVWAITNSVGFGVFSEGLWQTYDVFNSGLVDDRIRAIAIAPGSQVWLGTDDSGISVLTLPGFQLRTRSGAVLIEPGESTVVRLEIVASGGFEGAVSLMAEDVPPGVDVAFDPSVVWTRGSVRMIVSVAPATPPGIYVLTIVARSDTGLASTRQLNLYVLSKVWRVYLPVSGR